MINQMHISNFQSHKYTKLDFDPGVNIIVGESDTGKSAIIRALRWLIYNRPSGDIFKSDWAKDEASEVKISLEEGSCVIRTKGKNYNQYVITDNKAHPLEFSAVKTDIPDEVINELNLNNVNLQMQGDNHFLINGSPGEVAQHFNKIAHLSQIDQGLQFVEKKYRNVKSEIDHDTGLIKEFQESLQDYEYLEKFEKEVEVLESWQLELNRIQNAIDKLVKVSTSLDNIEEEISTKYSIIESEEEVNNIIEIIDQRKVVAGEWAKLHVFESKLNTIKDNAEEYNNLLEAEDAVDQIINLNNNLNDLESKIGALKQLSKKLNTIQEERNNLEFDLEVLEWDFQDEMGEVCILCGNKI